MGLGIPGTGTPLSYNPASIDVPKIKLEKPSLPGGIGGGGGGGRGGGGSKGLSEEAREAERWIERTKTAAERYNEELRELAELNEEGYFKDAPEAYARAVDMVGDAFVEAEFGKALDAVGNITDSLVDAAFASGSLGDAFRATLRQMGADWAKSGLRDLASEIFGGGRTATSGGFFGSLVGAIFGGFRAGGGDVSKGKAYEVGENGREWFVPSEDGTILPHGKTPFDGVNPGQQEIKIGFTQSSMRLTDDGKIVAEIGVSTDRKISQAAERADQALPRKVQQIQQNPRDRY
jgi:hypothetical protein